MIGVSLPLSWFISSDAEIKADEVLEFLKKQGVDSVELRTVRPYHEPEDVLKAANTLWDNGFYVTVHGSVTGLETAVADVFAPLGKVLPALRQDKLNVTIHPICENNTEMLLALSDHILDNNYPVTIALENNRKMPDKTEGDSTLLVLEAVTAADRKNVGICFDMGHYAYYVKKNHPDTPDMLPAPEFFKRVIHTHIHATKGLRTHYPLGVYDLQLDEILQKLSFGYFGVYNLELDFPRLKEEWTPLDALAQSIPYLRDHLHYCAKLYDTVRRDFDSWFLSALKCWDTEPEGCNFSLIHSSAYLFHTNGCKWAMDIAFRNARILAKTPARAAELMKDMQMMVLSHGHRDHFEESTIRLLKDSDIIWVVPDFLEERILGLGVRPEKLRVAKRGEVISLFGMDILPFESKHFRSSNGVGVKEYGYYITAPGCPSLAFPVDIRNFNQREDVPMADYCFANVWLEDNSADEESWRSMVEPFAKYMLSFSNKTILLTHLFEDGRPDHKMWRSEHAHAVADKIHALSPETRVIIPRRGECIQL